MFRQKILVYLFNKSTSFLSYCKIICRGKNGIILLFIIVTVVVAFGTDKVIQEDIIKHKNWNVQIRDNDCGSSFSDRAISITQHVVQLPWLAIFGYSLHPGIQMVDVYDCGGSIISNRYILTAAHCINPVNMTLLSARLGDLANIGSAIECANKTCVSHVQEIRVEKKLCHPGFNKVSNLNDIGLVRLTKLIEFNYYARPICLPTYDTFKDMNFERTIMEVARRSFTYMSNKTTTQITNIIKVSISSHKKCQDIYSTTIMKVTKNQLCAGGAQGKKTCKGDSGYPMMKVFPKNNVYRYFIIGIVSFGPYSCISHNPAVYTAVPKFSSWVQTNMEA